MYIGLGKDITYLSDEGFVARAPEAVVAKERYRLAACGEAKIKIAEQKATIAAL